MNDNSKDFRPRSVYLTNSTFTKLLWLAKAANVDASAIDSHSSTDAVAEALLKTSLKTLYPDLDTFIEAKKKQDEDALEYLKTINVKQPTEKGTK